MNEIYFFILILILLNVVSGIIKKKKRAQQQQQRKQWPGEEETTQKPESGAVMEDVMNVLKREMGLEPDKPKPVEQPYYTPPVEIQKSAVEPEPVHTDDDYTDVEIAENSLDENGQVPDDGYQESVQGADSDAGTSGSSAVDETVRVAEFASGELERSLAASREASLAGMKDGITADILKESRYPDMFRADPRSAFIMGEIFNRKY